MAEEIDQDDEQREDGAPEEVTKMVLIGGREVLCRFLTEAQFMQLAYEAQVLEAKQTPNERKIKTLSRIFRVMRSVVVEDDDRDYVEDLMADGTINMNTILAVIKELNDSTVKKAPAKVRRGVPARRG